MTKTLHRDPDRRCMPLGEWPVADRQLWLNSLADADPLEEPGARSHLNPYSNRKVVKGYGRWLTWLSRHGILETEKSCPGDRITPDRVRNWVKELRQFNASGTIIGRLQELHSAACVMKPSGAWQWIRRLESQVRAAHKPARQKRARLTDASELLSLGCQLMTQSEAADTRRQKAIIFRDGLLIALASLRPLRLRNLANLSIGTTLVKEGDFWQIAFAGHETKAGNIIEFPWPEVLHPALEIYLEEHRPWLANATGRWHKPAGAALWLSADGSPLTRQAIYDRIAERTLANFGKVINPHMFRDCAMTTLAILSPGQVQAGSRLLGHTTLKTAEKFYNQAQAIEAVRTFQSAVVGLRGDRDR